MYFQFLIEKRIYILNITLGYEHKLLSRLQVLKIRSFPRRSPMLMQNFNRINCVNYNMRTNFILSKTIIGGQNKQRSICFAFWTEILIQ